MLRVVMMKQMNEEVNRDKTGEPDGKNLEVDSRDGVMHIQTSDLTFNEEIVGGGKGVTTDEELVLRGG